MRDLTEIVQRCMIKHLRKIKILCSPLEESLHIPLFGYIQVRKDGTFCNISNALDCLEYFYDQKLYFKHSYTRDPGLFHSGYTIARMTNDNLLQKYIMRQYEVNYMFLILHANEQQLEGFFFAHKNQDDVNCYRFLNQIHLLDKFACYFKREAHSLIDKAISEGFNLKEAMEEAFYEVDPSIPLIKKEIHSQKFLKQIFPLSLREQQCLNLFKQGRSAQATAAMLNLSQRTVEHYFESIKNKLGCQSKMELLER